MFLWIFVFIIVVIMWGLSISTKNVKYKKILAVATLSILCIISGTRYNTGGTDYFVYKRVYDFLEESASVSDNINKYNLYSMESGFIVYMVIIKKLGFNFYGFTLINSIIFYYLFYKVLKRYDYNINFILILFLYKMFFYNTLISMRQPIAILIFWIALQLLKEKKYIKYYLMCFLAMFFHNSSVILFVLPFITNLNITKNKFLAILIICLPFYFIHISNFSFINSILKTIFYNDTTMIGKIEGYMSSSGGMSIFYVLEYYLIAIMVYFKYDSIYKYDENSSFFIKLFLCLIPFYTIFANISIVTRFKDFFFLAYPIMIIYIAKSQKKYAKIIYIFVIMICFYGYFRYLNNFDSGALLNYKTFLFKNLDMFK